MVPGLPSPEDVLPLLLELLPRARVMVWVQGLPKPLRWRLLNPLVMVWGFIFQRLNADHTCEAALVHLQSGAVDAFGPTDPRRGPLSQQLKSASTSAYVQGRQRLPLTVLDAALQAVSTVILNWLQAPAASDCTWKGHVLRYLDGTTFRLRPTPALSQAYPPAGNQHGAHYWLLVRSLVIFCGYSQAVVAYAEAPYTTSETALVQTAMRQDPHPQCLYVADRYFGSFRFLQVARACQQQVVVRLSAKTARWLLKDQGQPRTPPPGTDLHLTWTFHADRVVEPDLPTTAIPGRWLYARYERPGFRPVDLFLFTTLLEAERYPLADLVALYAQRWQAEIDFRHLKTTLGLEAFAVKTPAMFRKELAAGLLAYNVVCAFLVRAALRAQQPPSRLSFSRCRRRLTRWFTRCFQAGQPVVQALEALLDSLARCLLPHQPNKVAHEPRQVRRQPAVFPTLKGTREAARQQLLQKLSDNVLS
jgi:hypothetical protein